MLPSMDSRLRNDRLEFLVGYLREHNPKKGAPADTQRDFHAFCQ